MREAAAIFEREKADMAAALREKEGLIAKLEAEAEALRATMRRWVRQRWRGMAWRGLLALGSQRLA